MHGIYSTQSDWRGKSCTDRREEVQAGRRGRMQANDEPAAAGWQGTRSEKLHAE